MRLHPVFGTTMLRAVLFAGSIAGAAASVPAEATAAPCRDWFVTIRLTDAEDIPASIQYRIGYSTNGTFVGVGGDVLCEPRVEALFAANHSFDGRFVRMGLIGFEDLSIPTALARCRFREFSADPPAADEFSLALEEASNKAFEPIDVTATLRFAEAGELEECGDRCGDGFLDSRTEQCDDGNTASGDGCPSNCQPPSCGNGEKDSEIEECDDGNLRDWDSCLPSCLFARCGDGIIRSGYEVCDDGNSVETDGCTSLCTRTCGNGIVEHEAGEECDDANTLSGDECTRECLASRCGDRYVFEGVEQCDDGNTSNSDVCNEECMRAVCGDGFLRPLAELCDDGNSEDDDECPNDCGVHQSCGDTIPDGQIRAGDSLRALQAAVGRDVECARWAGDVDSSGIILTSDALRILRFSVDQPVTLICNAPSELRLRLSGPPDLATVVADVDLSEAAAELVGEAEQLECEALIGGSSMTFELVSEDLLRMTVVVPGGLGARKSLARCDLVPWGPLGPDRFTSSVLSATTLGGAPAAGVTVRAIPY